MEQIFNLFLATFETILLLFFFNTLLIKIDELEQERHIAFFFYFIFQCITYLIDFPFFSTSYFYIAFSVAIAFFFYYNDIRIKLLASGMFVTLNYASKLLAISLFSLSHKGLETTSPFEYVLDSKMQLTACLIMTFITFIIVIMRKIPDRISKFIINVIIFILPFIILFMSVHILKNVTSINLYFNVTSLLFSYSLLLFFIVDQIIYSNQNTHQANLVNERLRMQKKYYKDMEKYNQNMSRYKHDMINHLDSVYEMLNNDMTEDAKNYLLSMNQQLHKVEAVINTGNSVIDVIFNSKSSRAKENDIRCTNTIVVPPHLKIDSVDLSVILSNILDNAIEANLKLETNRFIDTHIHIYKKSLFISVKNPYNGEIKSSKKHFLTTKNNRQEHGIGLMNVSYAIQKNKGTKNIEYDNETFTISIIIPNACD